MASLTVGCFSPTRHRAWQVAIGGAAVAVVVAVAFGLKKAADNGDLDHLDQTAKRKVLLRNAVSHDIPVVTCFVLPCRGNRCGVATCRAVMRAIAGMICTIC